MKFPALIAVLLILFNASSLLASQPLVTADWLAANLDKPDLLILDLQPSATYRKVHIPGAIHSDYENWRATDANGVTDMLPAHSALEKMTGRLGIDNKTHIILIITGQNASEMASATRVYWTFKLMGHDKISILDGGLIAYAKKRDKPLERKINQPVSKSFKSNPGSGYRVTTTQLNGSLNTDAVIVDGRSGAEFIGLWSGGAKERPGTIPGAVNLPFNWLTINGGAQFQSIENLKNIYKHAAVPLQGQQISFCHTGHRASLNWFVSHELLGNKEASLYDGSTIEWATDPSLPLELKYK